MGKLNSLDLRHRICEYIAPGSLVAQQKNAPMKKSFSGGYRYLRDAKDLDERIWRRHKRAGITQEDLVLQICAD